MEEGGQMKVVKMYNFQLWYKYQGCNVQHDDYS